MSQRPHRVLLAVTCALLLAALACAFPGGSVVEEPTPTDASPAAKLPDLGRETSGAVSSLDDVKKAMIQIEAEGSFVDPQLGELVNVAGRGSGFIIDPSGLAVTNNHVVTGAALLKVWVGGDSTPKNARVIGVSECSDLAVIDIEGDGYPYLDWYDGDVNVGLEVYAAGFPLGDPEYTLTKGIVSKAKTDGETMWASVNGVLEHDATINPGNSGGPLVDSNGKVVAINYASSPAFSQYFAIKHEEAEALVGRLRNGENVDSIGVNGVAVVSGDGMLSGIWVASVASGSPADEAGVQPGDVITKMEGLVLATDGTMADYCDVLRTHGSERTLSIEVLRYSDSQVMVGQLNGRPLETSVSFASELASQAPSNSTNPTDRYTDYTYVQDNYGAIEVEIPSQWTDIDGRPWADQDGVYGAAISAAPNLDDYYSSWDVPGMFFAASDDVARWAGYVQVLDWLRQDYINQCKLDDRYDYEDPYYRGKYDYFYDCGGPGGSGTLLLTAVDKDDPQAFIIALSIQIASRADLEAADHILDSFQVIGSLP